MSDRIIWPGEHAEASLSLRPYGECLPPLRAQGDALSDPDAALIASTLYELLPRGAAWQTPDGAAFEPQSWLGGLMRGFAGALASLYARLFSISQESTAVTLSASLEDWEADYGLPDPCLGGEQSIADRTQALLVKIRSRGTITPVDFVLLAALAGHDVTIEEPNPFECGVSDCGGADMTGDTLAYVWIVHVRGSQLRHFEVSSSECGVDRLTDFALATSLECLFRAVAPAWTRPIFNYDGVS